MKKTYKYLRLTKTLKKAFNSFYCLTLPFNIFETKLIYPVNYRPKNYEKDKIKL